MSFTTASRRRRVSCSLNCSGFVVLMKACPVVSYVPQDIEAILADLQEENDRAVAIVGASMVEYALEQALQATMRAFDPTKRQDKDDLERLFGGNGPFSGMSAKILAAYALRIIGPSTRRDLDLINKIRNAFAHDMNPLAFTDEQVSNRCKQLERAKNSIPAKEEDMRGVFLVSVQIYSSVLQLWAIKELLPTTEVEKIEILSWLSV